MTSEPVRQNRYCGSKRPHPPHEHSLVEGKIFHCKGKERARDG